MRRTIISIMVGAFVAVGLVGALQPSQVSAHYAQSQLVSSTPVSFTPQMDTEGGYNVSNNEVHDQAVVGDTAYVGGHFKRWTNAGGTVTYNRQNFVAYNVKTGAVSPLVYNFNGDVQAVVGSTAGSAVYIGGTFSSVNGHATNGLIKLNTATGQMDTSFKWAGGNVYALAYGASRLYVGGSFAKRLTIINPSTGADTGEVNVSVQGDLDSTGKGIGGPVRVSKIGLNPAGADFVVLGNFTTVNGQSRREAFRMQLSGGSSRLTTWHPARYNYPCHAATVPYYVRDVDWSPDGNYFVIVGTGGTVGYPSQGLCDSAARWEAASTGTTAEPTWINWTGGDTLDSVAVSGAAIYVGGHNRWLDNPQGHDSAGPGAYEVDSIGAIDPTSGKAIRTWNAMPMDRGHGKEDLTLFAGGLLEGSDGSLVKGQTHKGTALFPL